MKGKYRIAETCLDSLLPLDYRHSWAAYPPGLTNMQSVYKSPYFALTHREKNVCCGVGYLGGKLGS